MFALLGWPGQKGVDSCRGWGLRGMQILPDGWALENSPAARLLLLSILDSTPAFCCALRARQPDWQPVEP